MSRRPAITKIRGFSLVELAVVLVIIGAIGLVFWRALFRFKSLPAIGSLTATSLPTAEATLNGFILAQGRLPCPATTANGVEDCSASMGWLPVRTLGMSLSENVRYGLYRNPTGAGTANVDLGITSDKYVPNLPPGYLSNNTNGLDFCENLRNLMRSPGTALTAGAGASQLAIAYGLAVAGAGDADGDGNPFDGLNTQPGQFELTGKSVAAGYNDSTLTVGAGELFTRLGCASLQSTTSGLAKAAYAAYDINRFAIGFVNFRDFEVTVRENNKQQADANLALSVVDMLNAIATSAESVALAAETAGVTAPVVIAAGLAVTAAGAALTAAALAIQPAVDAIALAKQHQAAAVNFQSASATDLTVAVQRVQAQDAKGLLP